MGGPYRPVGGGNRVRSGPMPRDANKELVRRFYREAIVERDSGACERLLSVDFVHNGETARPRRPAPGGRLLPRRLPRPGATRSSCCSARTTWSPPTSVGAGTHGGEFLGVAATGRRVEFTSTAVLRVRDGLIAEAWDEMDSGAILAQLGGDDG